MSKREIVVRVKDVSAETNEQIVGAFADIEELLKGQNYDYDGVLISVKSGVAYAYKEVAPKNTRKVTA